MRTQQELFDYATGPGQDFFGFALEAVAGYMPFDIIKDKLKEGYTQEMWDMDRVEYTEENVRKDLAEYMRDYGWPKALGHRGISASRSVTKIGTWAYALGHDTQAILKSSEWGQYGAGHLAVFCKLLDLPIPEGEDVENMIAGRPCEPGCEIGCGT